MKKESGPLMIIAAFAACVVVSGCSGKKQESAVSAETSAKQEGMGIINQPRRAESAPKRMIDRAFESQVKADLAVLREAINHYYGTNSKYPETFDQLIPEYIAKLPEEGITKSVMITAVFDGSGGWVYDGNGGVKANIAGIDMKGVPYKDW